MDYPGKVITKTAVTPTQTSATGVWTLDDAAAAVKNNNWPVAGVPNPISKSLRFNSADSANLTRTPSVNGNRQTWTWSAWIKRANLSQAGTIWGSNFASGGFGMAFGNYGGAGVNPQIIGITLYGVGTVTTNAVFRDPSAWYHIVARFDSTQAAQADRFRLYVNNVQQTLSANLNVTQNADYHVNESGRLQTLGGESGYFNDLYMAEVNHIDGQSLTPSSFGMTDPQTGAWEPIRYTGTYGTNGFYLNFKDATSTTTLGYDYSGNGNNYTPNNFSVTAGAGNDSLTDVPTPWIAYNTTGDVGGVVRGNYCTWNPLDKGTVTVTNGNLDAVSAADVHAIRATMSLPTTGKWYWETTVSALGYLTALGIADGASSLTTGPSSAATRTYQFGSWFNSFNSGIVQYGTNQAIASGTNWTGASQPAANDVIMFAVDRDNGSMWVGRNGTWFNSSGTANPATNTDPRWTGLGSGDWFAYMAGYGTTTPVTCYANFGQRPFAYTPPAGFLSLCTTNLPNPTIGTSTTTQAGKYMNVVLYTGDGNNGRSITGVGFQTDFNWTKSRSSGSYFHQLSDAVRGFDKYLYSNATNAEGTDATNHIQSVNSDGYVINSGASFNANTVTYVAWNWNAGGSNATNTSGTITSTVRANTTAGFSIVTYTGTGSNATVGHGLGVAPSMIICKGRSTTDNWIVYHASLGNQYAIYLNLTNAQAGPGSLFWNSTTPTSSVFSLGGSSAANTNGATQVAYCFAPIAGYSAFGSYTGNGSTDGPFVYLGFRPKYLMVKRSDSGAESWYVTDSARGTYNLITPYLTANEANQEFTANMQDFLSNGFKIRGSGTYENASGGTYIYAAFAEFPFKFANAR